MTEKKAQEIVKDWNGNHVNDVGIFAYRANMYISKSIDGKEAAEVEICPCKDNWGTILTGSVAREVSDFAKSYGCAFYMTIDKELKELPVVVARIYGD